MRSLATPCLGLHHPFRTELGAVIGPEDQPSLNIWENEGGVNEDEAARHGI